MKYIFLILSIFAVCTTTAQDPRIIDTWYLQNLIMDGQDNYPPVNGEVPYIRAIFSETEFFTDVCDAISGTIVYHPSNPEFNIDGGMTLLGCSLQVNNDYQEIYLVEFYFNNLTDVFTYEIVEGSNDSKTLTVTNIVGDQAIYGNELLSNDHFKKSKFSIHPNPAKEELFITSKNTTGNLEVQIFNIESKLIRRKTLVSSNKNSIKVSQLESGIYFLDIADENGNTTVKKFVKE